MHVDSGEFVDEQESICTITNPFSKVDYRANELQLRHGARLSYSGLGDSHILFLVCIWRRLRVSYS